MRTKGNYDGCAKLLHFVTSCAVVEINSYSTVIHQMHNIVHLENNQDQMVS